MAMSSTFLNDVSAFENGEMQTDNIAAETSDTGFSGRIRVGYISIDNEVEARMQSSAIGAELNYSSASWQGLTANGSLYTTQKIFHDDEGSFFGSDGDGYAVLVLTRLMLT